MAGHLVILLYVVSLISGLLFGLLIFLEYKRSLARDLLRYLEFFISFSYLIIFACVTMYINVNIEYSDMNMLVFAGGVMLGVGAMSYTLPRYYVQVFNLKLSKAKNRLFLFVWLLSPVLVLALFLLSRTVFILIPVLINLGLFLLISGYCLFLLITYYHKIKDPLKRKEILYTIGLYGLFIALGALEFYYNNFINPQTKYILTLPLGYLICNIIEFMLNYRYRRIFYPELKQIITAKSGPYGLTKREIEIAHCILKGYGNKEIAYELEISFSTVKNHIYSLYQKLNVQSRLELVNFIKPITPA